MYLRADAFRNKLSEQLSGVGMELGPGQICFEAKNAESLLLVDKLPSELHKELFPELGPNVQIVEPDLLVDFDRDGLKSIPDRDFDFVIASHLLEHLAQPFRILDEIWHKLSFGGVLILFLPDRRRTFDRNRKCPTFEHFLHEYLENSSQVNEEDLYDYLLKVENYSWDRKMNKFVERHLERSIHVHAWTDFEFVELLSRMQTFAQFRFVLVDSISASSNPDFEEFGLVLQKVASIDGQPDLLKSWHSQNPKIDSLSRSLLADSFKQFRYLAGKQLRNFWPR
jgi:SAM-dependent methyltransferase